MKRDKNQVTKRVFAILEAARKKAKGWQAESRIDEITVHTEGYAEPGYSDPDSGVICTGNWNTVTEWDREKNESKVIDDTPGRIAKLFEKLGVELEWSDEWVACEQCGKLVRCQADSYSWTRQYWDSDDGPVCVECVQENPEDYLQSFEGNTGSAITIDGIDPTEHGYKLLESGFENGLYGGQADDPKKIGKALEEQGVERFIFRIDSVGQFDMDFSVYVHEDDMEKLNKEVFDESEKVGPDPARQMESYLRDASQKMGTLPAGPGVRVSQPDPDDPTRAKVKLVSPEDFIAGKALDR